MNKFFYILLIIACSLGTAKADLLNFDFSITDDPNTSHDGFSDVSGTITGEIIGLQNNATSDPTNIIITSIPSGLGIAAPPDYSLAANQWNLKFLGSFTVSNGVITSATSYTAQLYGAAE